MAAQDGVYRDGAYHFTCEACGGPATARRAHARTCSPACAARLRRRRDGRSEENSTGPAPTSEPVEFRFYLSRRKLQATLEKLSEGDGISELVVAFRRKGGGPELALLRVEETHHDDGGLVCTMEAPYDPFPPVAPLPESS